MYRSTPLSSIMKLFFPVHTYRGQLFVVRVQMKELILYNGGSPTTTDAQKTRLIWKSFDCVSQWRKVDLIRKNYVYTKMILQFLSIIDKITFYVKYSVKLLNVYSLNKGLRILIFKNKKSER